MKKMKYAYWIVTGLISLMMLFAGYSYLSNPEIKVGFTELGFPDFFRIELGIAKLIGAILLLVPLRRNIKEWVYAGFGIVFISALIAHSAHGDPISAKAAPVIAMILLIVSYVFYGKVQRAKTNKTTD